MDGNIPTKALYAHSGRAGQWDTWEPLPLHLEEVGARAGTFAAAFGQGPAARAMGLLHDLGKAAQAYQSYIRGKGESPDHSTAGALAATAHYGKGWGKLLAFGIAGHHAGLANGAQGGDLTPLSARLARVPPPPLPPWLELPAAGELGPFPRAHGPFATAFLARMLFSCLVDADRLATEEFYARLEEKAVERGHPWGLADLKQRLDAHLADLAAKAAAAAEREPALGPVNALRARVLATVRDRAKLEPGLFSLTVPTGGGKTLASLAFALDHGTAHVGTHKFRRVIHVIPFTSIVEQTADVFRAALGDADAVLEHHSGFDPDAAARAGKGADDEGRDGALKARLAAENWDRPVVVTTAVQFFESLFSNRPGRCRKLHAIAGSVIVLDEAQTLPLPFLRPVLEAIRTLARHYNCSVVLCTATQPAVNRADDFTDGLDGVRELAPEPEALYAALRRVTVTQVPGTLDVPALAGHLSAEPQVMAITNNRRHARDLFEAVRGETGARLLTTALCAAHRRAVLAQVRQDLKDGLPVRLVATSLVEAGVDVSFPAVWRAIAGLDSVAQAAGRCNRNGELGPGAGRVFVFTPAPAPGHAPPPELEAFAEEARAVMADGGDPLGLKAIRAYFQGVYWQYDRGGALDRADVGGVPGILKALAERGTTLDFPFADIAKAFRLIEETQRPVIIAHGPWRETAERLLADLRWVPSPGGIARKLQPYVVQVPRRGWDALWKAGALEAVERDKYGDQFVKLANPSLYDPVAGLRWDDPTFVDVESLLM